MIRLEISNRLLLGVSSALKDLAANRPKGRDAVLVARVVREVARAVNEIEGIRRERIAAYDPPTPTGWPMDEEHPEPPPAELQEEMAELNRQATVLEVPDVLPATLIETLELRADSLLMLWEAGLAEDPDARAEPDEDPGSEPDEDPDEDPGCEPETA